MKNKVIIIALGVVLLSFYVPIKKDYTLVITNANIVDVVNGKVIKNQLLAISNDTIKAIDDTQMAENYHADQYLNAEGKFLLPGLWDMHVHFRGGDTLINENEALLPLFLAYGITTVRDAGGDITPAVKKWQEQIKAGTLAGPQIFTSGPKLDGIQSSWPGSIELSSVDQVSAALDTLQEIGVDYVKIYDASLPHDVFLEIIAQAEERGLKTTGHIPITVTLHEAMEQGLDAAEHMFSVLKACSSKEDSLTHIIRQQAVQGEPVGFYTALQWAYNSFDTATALQLFSQMAKYNTAVVPTLYVTHVVFNLHQTDHSQDSLLAFIGPGIQQTYAKRLQASQQLSAEQRQFQSRMEQKFFNMIPLMHKAGVTLLAGSDCGPFNSFVYPGESLHQELKLLVASGLTPVQALQTATINGAKFMGLDHFYGTIAQGKSSDLVILDNNPLLDINAIDNINTVITKSRLYTKKDMDHLLQTLKE